eukprot:596942-Prorocentrum_lima.AAC.1
MTSSLVGSEMCIRDRTRTTAGTTDDDDYDGDYSIDGDDDAVIAEGKETVSYTHLTLPTICSV